MSFLVFTARQYMLKHQRSEINYRLMQKQQELMDLQSYTAAIGDGSVSLNDLTTVPSTMMGRLSQYMVASNNFAGQTAGMDMTQLSGVMGMQQAQSGQVTNPQYQMLSQQLMYNNLYQQRLDQFRKSEEKKLQVKEKSMEQECLKLQNELKLVENELQALESAIGKSAQELAPKFA